MKEIIIAILVGLSIGVTSIAMTEGIQGKGDGNVYKDGGRVQVVPMSQEYINAHPEGGPVASMFVPYEKGEVGYYPDGVTTLIKDVCGYAGAPYGACTPEMIEKSKRGWQGLDNWTEKIRRENEDGTYYFVYRDHK